MDKDEQIERRPEGKEGTGAHQEGSSAVQAGMRILSQVVAATPATTKSKVQSARRM